MTAEEYLAILERAGGLKTVYRHCETEPGRRESVADHSWRLALMAMLLPAEALEGADRDRVIRMCLIHDLGEAFTGDVPAFRKTAEDAAREEAARQEWTATFPEAQRGEWTALLEEMEARESPEARLYRALDKMEALLSHDESPVETWLPLEHALQIAYGREETDGVPFLSRVRETVDAWSREKTRAAETGARDPRRLADLK